MCFRIKHYSDENTQLQNTANALQTENTYIKETIIKCFEYVNLLGDTSHSTTCSSDLMKPSDLIAESNLQNLQKLIKKILCF